MTLREAIDQIGLPNCKQSPRRQSVTRKSFAARNERDMPHRESHPLSLRVLLVDDEEPFARVLTERLSARNLTVMTALSGQAALSLLERLEMDVVILDVCMPELGGIEVLRRIRERSPEIKVILLSGRDSIKDAIEGMHLGAFDYLPKPLPVDNLVKRIREAALEPVRRDRSEAGAARRP